MWKSPLSSVQSNIGPFLIPVRVAIFYHVWWDAHCRTRDDEAESEIFSWLMCVCDGILY